LTRYKRPLKLKDWAFAIAKRSTMRKARIALVRHLAIIMQRHAATRYRVQTGVDKPSQPERRLNRAPERSDARGREQMTAPILWHAARLADCDFNRAAPHPVDPIKCPNEHVENADTPTASISLITEPSPLDPLENGIGHENERFEP
jgi:hypothetical protein